MAKPLCELYRKKNEKKKINAKDEKKKMKEK
jgi:hypothetical protein